MWMVAKRATSTPLNPKSHMQNQGKGGQVYEQYFVFLVNREESRNFDVFFCVFSMCFLCLEERKNVQKNQAKGKTQKNVVYSKSEGCPGLFIAPTQILRRRPFNGHQPQTSSNRVDLDTPGKILISCFQKGMDLENPTVGLKVMALGSQWCID